MFELVIKKQDLINPLLTVAGALDKKQSIAILSNFLLKLSDNQICLTATDLEIEITARVACFSEQKTGSITIPSKKFIEIIRSLDENVEPRLIFKDGTLIIKQGRSSFKLATLAADTYPESKLESNEVELTVPRLALLELLQSTYFAMSQQDVRFFLNGLLIEFDAHTILAVGSDGHRMAINRFACERGSSHHKLLFPRKGVQELLRVLTNITDEQVTLSAGKNHITCISNDYDFSSKLIEARFPPYTKAIPRDNDKELVVDCALFKRSLTRMVILANEKSKGVLLHMQPNQVTLIANNQEQEEAIETLEAQTTGDEIIIGLNAMYLIDVLTHFGDGAVRLSMSTTDSSILVESLQDANYQYILMPMKI